MWKTYSWVLILFTILLCNMSKAQNRLNLSDYRWKNRLILLFAENEDESAYKAQEQNLTSITDELEDRDLLVLHFFADGTGRLNNQSFPKEDIIKIRHEYRVVDNESVLILIGKDGGEKMRKQMPVDVLSVFGLIDQMPMRQSEMRRQKY